MRHVALVLVLMSALMLGPVGVAFPNGIGEQGDDGCLCHGGASLEDTIHLHGWPETYTPGQAYPLHVNASVPEGLNGGFRLLVNAGNLTANATSTAQAMEGGLTHTTPSSIREGWTVLWVAPNTTDQAVRAVLHVNVVNGNGAEDGDQWTSLDLVAVGPDHEGPIDPLREDGLTPAVLGIAALGLLAAFGLLTVGLREPGEE